MNTKNVIVLGGVENHKVLIQKLKDRGFYTILVDYLPNPPAASVADEHCRISTFDVPAIVKLVKERNAAAVLNACLEHVNVVQCEVAAQTGIPMLYDKETALNVSDKERMKRIMKENDIPTTDYLCIKDISELEGRKLRFPLFIKPTDNSGSTGVNRATAWEQVPEFVSEAIKFSKSGRAIVEEEAKGRECNVYCFIQNGNATVLLISEKFSEIGAKGDHKNTKCCCTLSPALISEKVDQEIRQAASKIAKAFSLLNTPMFMQIKVDGDRINIIEFACRMPGGFSHRNILNKLGVDLFDLTIGAYFGENIPINPMDNGKICTVNSFYAEPCIFDHVEGQDDLIKQRVIRDISIVRGKGTEISRVKANTEKIGFFIVEGDTIEEVLNEIEIAMHRLNVYDSEGNPVMRKDFYLRMEDLRNE